MSELHYGGTRASALLDAVNVLAESSVDGDGRGLPT